MSVKTDDIKEKDNIKNSDGKDGLRIAVFLILVFVITYIYEYVFVVKPIMSSSNYNIANQSLKVAMAMFTPALCVVITRLVTHEGFSSSCISFNLKEGRYKYYLMAWFLPSLITLAGTLLYFVFFKSDFSADMKFLIDTYAKQGIADVSPVMARTTIISQAVTAILIGPVINCLTCFGEEWGWRGYLLQKLKGRFKPLPLMMIMGLIWGLWHLPLTVVGHNYGMDYAGYPYLGVAAMILFCFSIGTLLAYVTLKTGSCIPAIIGHGAINSFASIGIYFTTDGGHMLFGPSPAGILAGIPLLILAIVLIWFMSNNVEKEK